MLMLCTFQRVPSLCVNGRGGGGGEGVHKDHFTECVLFKKLFKQLKLLLCKVEHSKKIKQQLIG